MPYCSVLECKNDSKRISLKNGGVSYHRFPKDPNIKEKWIDATGRINWMPTNSSTICSEHFLDGDLIISNKGYRYTKPTALPSIKILKFIHELQNDNVITAGSSKRKSDSESSDSKKSQLHECIDVEQNFIQKENDMIPVKLNSPHDKETVKNVDIMVGSDCSTPREKKLEGQIRFCKNKIVRQGLKIKRLQLRNRKLKKKIKNINEEFLRLEEKYAIAEENLDCLKNLEAQELVVIEINNTE